MDEIVISIFISFFLNGAAIKFIKSKLPTANGKTVSDIVKEAIEQQ